MKERIILIIMCVFIYGCSNSPHKNYYLLNPPSIVQNKYPVLTENITQSIGIGPVEMADYLNRSKIVVDQTNNVRSNNTLMVSDTDYWAEPLDKGIARVIALDLLQRNGNRSFIYFPWRSDSKPLYSLRVQINSLMCTNGQANMVATWEVLNNASKSTVERRHFIRAIPVEPGTKNLAQAYSQLLDDMAGEMDKALQKMSQ